MKPAVQQASKNFPPEVTRLLWDVDPRSLKRKHMRFLFSRILTEGDWDAVSWLRRTHGDGAIARWIAQRQGGGLDVRRLRFWAVVLRLPAGSVNGWVRKYRRGTWAGRVTR